MKPIVWAWIAGVLWFILWVGVALLLAWAFDYVRLAQLAVLSGFAPLIGYVVYLDRDLRRGGW